MNENGYNRSSIDLMYMVETYLENAEMLVTAADTRNYATMDAYNQRCEKVYRFLQTQMSKVHRELQRNHLISTAQLARYNTVISFLSHLTFGVILGFGVLLIYLLHRVILRPIHTPTSRGCVDSVWGNKRVHQRYELVFLLFPAKIMSTNPLPRPVSRPGNPGL